MIKNTGIFFLITTVIIVIITGCGREINANNQPHHSAQENQSILLTPTMVISQATENTSDTFNQLQALKILYDDTPSEVVDKDTAIVTEIINTQEYTSTVKVILATEFVEAQTERFVILTIQRSPVPCQACLATVAGAIFSKKENVWRLDSKKPFITQIGYGKAQARIVQIGDERFGFFIEDSVVFTGISSHHLVIVAPLQNELQIIASLDMGQADVATKQWRYSSSLNFTHHENDDYYALELTQTGSNQQQDGIVRVNKKTIYIFNGKEYISN